MRRGTAYARPHVSQIARYQEARRVPRLSVMAFYLVTAVPNPGLMKELSKRLAGKEIVAMKPFGRSLTYSLRNARMRKDGVAIWEEEDYCRPPLAQEREAVLDAYFSDLSVEPVKEGAGWEKIGALPRLFPEFAGA
jgi:hypothetical protein